MFREFGNDLGSGDARLEPERWTLDRGRRSFGRDIRQDLSNIDCVLRPFFGAPVRLVDLLFDDASLERTVRKRIHGVEIHVIVVEKPLQLVALGPIAHKRLCRLRRQAQGHTESFLWRDALFHFGNICRQAVPDFTPIVAGMNQCRICQMAETFAQIHMIAPDC